MPRALSNLHSTLTSRCHVQFLFLSKASITTPPNAEAAVEDQGSSSIAPPARADVEKEKQPAEPEAKSKHQVSDAKHQVIIPSKKLTSLAPTKAASKAVPRDPDAAGDVDVSDDSATTTSNHGGSGSDTNDSDHIDYEDPENNAYESKSNSGEESDLGTDADHMVTPDVKLFPPGARNMSELELADKPVTFNADKLMPCSEAELAALRLQPRRNFTDNILPGATAELAATIQQPRRNQRRTTSAQVPLYKESSSSVGEDKDLDPKGELYMHIIYLSSLHFNFTFHLYISTLHFTFTF
jgi:hypothetical protein